ncbi:glycoside hydrolase family 32 protein [Streptococcus merionis]|uniref:glycoside hydrolase family 32 protein n=1 Tax=Streptococcus merionis TaxID=400065 RepID=UPI0026EBAA91|nr:glycoside hydrolase family 32 protein [Streptococcus merionis]
MTETTFTLSRAEAFIAKQTAGVDQSFKPGAHFSAPIGWLNDPNGFVFFRGEYHLFYQFYPYDSCWGPMHWGHAKSKDLINWEHLPVALAPDQSYDNNGCFSGSAIVKDDRLWLMYTGNITLEDGTGRQVQNMAVSDDGVTFSKLASNPVMIGEDVPDIKPADFRDPKLFEKDGRYYSVLAAKHVDDVGCIVLLGSDDLENWSFESIFLKGEKDQGVMWECPDYFNLDGQDCLVISPMQFPVEGDDYQNLNSNIICYGLVDWESKTFAVERIEEIDHGHDFYAAQSLKDNQGRRIMIAWMQNWGRKFPTHDLRHGWAGLMTVPRQLQLVDGKLLQLPFLAEGSSDWTSLKAGERLESSKPWPIRLDLKTGLSQHWRLEVGSVVDQLVLVWQDGQLTLDRTGLEHQLGGEEKEPLLTRSIRLSEGLTDVTVLLDRSSIEVFVNGGQASLSSTAYIAEHLLSFSVAEGQVEVALQNLNE